MNMHLDESTPQWETIRQKVSRKLVIVPFGDQDGTNASYIRPNWPQLDNWQLAMVNFGYGVRRGLTADTTVYVSADWTRDWYRSTRECRRVLCSFENKGIGSNASVSSVTSTLPSRAQMKAFATGEFSAAAKMTSSAMGEVGQMPKNV